MATTVVQVSDPHLSGSRAFFVRNWLSVVASIRRESPTLVVSTGDVSINGVESAEDLQFAHDAHRRLGTPVLVTPGNHDVGEEPSANHTGQPWHVGTEQRWQAIFGPSWWTTNVEEWTLIGVNCFLFGTGSEFESEQCEWLSSTVNGASGPVGLFLHKPLYVMDRAEPPNLALTASQAARAVVYRLLDNEKLRFISHGHLHQYRRSAGRCAVISCPSTAFVSHAPLSGGHPSLGYLRWTFDGADFDVEFVEDGLLAHHDLRAIKGGHRFLYMTPPAPIPPAELAELRSWPDRSGGSSQPVAR
jgi:Icc-related predicted phosphoesterase